MKNLPAEIEGKLHEMCKLAVGSIAQRAVFAVRLRIRSSCASPYGSAPGVVFAPPRDNRAHALRELEKQKGGAAATTPVVMSGD
jgi:hypothetical protein